MKNSLRWWGWGETKVSYHIDHRPNLLKLLEKKFGITKLNPPFNPSLEQVKLPPCKLDQNVWDQLVSIFDTNIDQSPETRIRHTYGKSYRDIIRMRSLKIDVAPDAVVFPVNEDQIIRLMQICKDHHIAIMPFGGGSSVVGGLEPLRGKNIALIILNMTKMKAVLNIDKQSMTAEIEAGIFGPELERVLQAQGYTLGHFPQSFEFSTLGGWLAARSSGQNSMYYGSIHKLATSLKMISPSGQLKSITSPAHACGPDLKEILIGSEGGLGVITSAVMKIFPLPEEKHYFMMAFPNFDQASELCREIMYHKIPLSLMRISDEEESLTSLATAGGHATSWGQTLLTKAFKQYFAWRGLPLNGPLSLVLFGVEGSKEKNRKTLCQLNKILKKYRGLSLGKKSGEKWLSERFFLPYMRDELLDQGLFVDTMETVTTWSNLKNLYQQVKTALLEAGSRDQVQTMVLCHISHPYHEGASLYFTIIARQKSGQLLEQWQNFKTAANMAIKNAGGAISHHHGVGVDHAGYLPWGKTEQELMAGLKKTLDPEEMMNPEKLFPII